MHRNGPCTACGPDYCGLHHWAHCIGGVRGGASIHACQICLRLGHVVTVPLLLFDRVRISRVSSPPPFFFPPPALLAAPLPLFPSSPLLLSPLLTFAPLCHLTFQLVHPHSHCSCRVPCRSPLVPSRTYCRSTDPLFSHMDVVKLRTPCDDEVPSLLCRPLLRL